MFVPRESVDETWAGIKTATEEGRLGDKSKVATARPNRDAWHPNEHVICIYSYDWTDKEDVRRIRAELRRLGISARISYKSNEDTLKGKYRKKGHKNISKYYE